MAFPFLFQSDFEAGTVAEWTSETDTNNKLNVQSYRNLARLIYADPLPYRGAYCVDIDLSLGTADAYLQEDTGFDLAADGEYFVRFYLQATTDLVMAASDRFTILALQSAGPVNEVSVGLRNNAGTIELWMGETAATATIRTTPFSLGVWHAVEVAVVLDNGVGNDGTLTLYVDGAPVGAALTALDQAALVQGRLGAMDIDTGTTAGHLLLDQVVVDDTRVFPFRERYPSTLTLTKSGHAAIGLGTVAAVQLLGGAATDGQLRLYDSDQAEPQGEIGGSVATVVASDIREFRFPSGQGYFSNGLYVSLTGTNPQATIYLCQANMTAEQVRAYALRRR